MESTFVSSAPTPTLSISVVNKLRKLLKIGATSRTFTESAKRELPCSRSLIVSTEWPRLDFGGAFNRFRAKTPHDSLRLGWRSPRIHASLNKTPSPTKTYLPCAEPLPGLGVPSFIFTLARRFPINLQLVPTSLKCTAFSPLYSCMDEINVLRLPLEAS